MSLVKAQGFKQHKQLDIVPAMNLEEDAQGALHAARYHLEKIRYLVKQPGIQTMWKEDKDLDQMTRRRLQRQVNIFHFHVRAFFWELVATMDIMVERAKRKSGRGKWKKVFPVLETARNSEWFYEVDRYRNFLHRAFHFIQMEFGKERTEDRYKLKRVFMTPARVGQKQYVYIEDQLSNYWEKMRNLQEAVSKPSR